MTTTDVQYFLARSIGWSEAFVTGVESPFARPAFLAHLFCWVLRVARRLSRRSALS